MKELNLVVRQQVEMIREKITEYQRAGKKMFISSSFQTHSIPLLHIISEIDRRIPVYFLNTGFHFPETIIFKRHIAGLLDIKVIDLSSAMPKSLQKDQNGNFFFCSNPDYCCQLNKVNPLEPILIKNDIWITGVRRDQSSIRSVMHVEVSGPHETIRFHPMLEWDSKMIWEYRQNFDLPEHPLESEGFLSIGCAPCTEKHLGDDRSARWSGMNKEECGLHTTLAK